MPRSLWICSNRANPTHTSRRISGDHGSPMTSRLRAIEHAISPKLVRCMTRNLAAWVPLRNYACQVAFLEGTSNRRQADDPRDRRAGHDRRPHRPRARRRHGPGEDPYLGITRLTRDTGYAPAFDVTTAVADYVAWRADNPR